MKEIKLEFRGYNNSHDLLRRKKLEYIDMMIQICKIKKQHAKKHSRFYFFISKEHMADTRCCKDGVRHWHPETVCAIVARYYYGKRKVNRYYYVNQLNVVTACLNLRDLCTLQRNLFFSLREA